MPSDEILIVGAGIGGLVTALSLHEVGFRVRVFESVDAVEPIGAGINLLPHATRELYELGLADVLEPVSAKPRELAYFTKRGQRIWAEPRGREAGYHWPQISIHRGILQRELLHATQGRIGRDRIHTGHHLESFESRPGEVHARFVQRHTGETIHEARGAVLIGADGIHSAVRRALEPDEGPPRWNGAILWRGVADAAPFLDGRTMIMAGHAEQKFVCYPIGPAGSSADTGSQPINFVAEIRFDASRGFEPEDWNKAGKLDDFLPAFEPWRFDWLDVPELIRATPQIWVYPMVDRDPLTRWSHGRVTLLGDAAHPMYPIGSNGASQAILDARVLAGCLRHYADDVERGLARYEEIRRPATAEIVLANRGQGPERPMQIVEERAPDGFDDLHDVISRDELEAIASQYKRVAGFAVAELNARGRLTDPTP